MAREHGRGWHVGVDSRTIAIGDRILVKKEHYQLLDIEGDIYILEDEKTGKVSRIHFTKCTYCPTQETVYERRDKIKEGWSEAEKIARAGGKFPVSLSNSQFVTQNKPLRSI